MAAKQESAAHKPLVSTEPKWRVRCRVPKTDAMPTIGGTEAPNHVLRPARHLTPRIHTPGSTRSCHADSVLSAAPKIECLGPACLYRPGRWHMEPSCVAAQIHKQITDGLGRSIWPSVSVDVVPFLSPNRRRTRPSDPEKRARRNKLAMQQGGGG